MDNLSDDDYDHLSDVDVARSESERPPISHDSVPSSPPSVQDLRGSSRKTLACPYQNCPKTFNRKARLEEHIRSHKNIRLFKCPHTPCDKDFLRQSHLNHHIKNAHSNIRDYKCTWEGCDKSFATGTRLRRHISAHEGREKFKCRGYEGCNETFRKHETLRKHILSIHEHISPFQCEEIDNKTGQPCTKSFETAEKLERHKRSLHDAMRFSCADCLIYQPVQEEAMVEDDFEVPFLIPQGYFATYSDLQAHIAEVHPPTCQFCPISFQSVKELTRHLEVQHGHIDPNTPKESTFSCTHPTCGRFFTKKGNLTVHMKTVHQKKKGFICGVTLIPVPEELLGQTEIQLYGCGRAFGAKSTLQDHVRIAHLGLQSKVVEGRHKRKAEQVADQERCEDLHELKKRAPRKDKGIPRTSVFTALTGMPATTNGQDPQANQYNVVDTKELLQTQVKNDKPTEEDVSDDENDDWNQMTGSMTICGSRMYHNGKEYNYTNGQYPSGLPLPQMSEDIQNRGQFQSIGKAVNIMGDFEEDAMFDNFEYEPENLYSMIDPVLLQS